MADRRDEAADCAMGTEGGERPRKAQRVEMMDIAKDEPGEETRETIADWLW